MAKRVTVRMLNPSTNRTLCTLQIAAQSERSAARKAKRIIRLLSNPNIEVKVRYPKTKGFLGFGSKPARTKKASGQISESEADRLLEDLRGSGKI